MKPGKPIRYTVEEKSRFKAVNITEWPEEYSIPVETMPLDDLGAGAVFVEKK